MVYSVPVTPTFLTQLSNAPVANVNAEGGQKDQAQKAQTYIAAYQAEYQERYGEISSRSDMEAFKAAIFCVAMIALTVLAATFLGMSAVAVAYKATGIIGICATGLTIAICGAIKFGSASSLQSQQASQLNTKMENEYRLRYNHPEQYPLAQPFNHMAPESTKAVVVGNKEEAAPQLAPMPLASAPPQQKDGSDA